MLWIDCRAPHRHSRQVDSESGPIPVPDNFNKEECSMFEIRTVTSISDETDSLVFKVHLQSLEYHPMRIALSNQSHITFDQELFSLIETPIKGTAIVGFGAQCRVAACTNTDALKASSGEHSLKGDIGLNKYTSAQGNPD
mmetsp:Transcript_22827/g.33710  ORF Transcript_22827/g.33710 Transcript_22827/m.33710 type:complete len:140 (+) Transcript_22827:596-1015(+)